MNIELERRFKAKGFDNKSYWSPQKHKVTNERFQDAVDFQTHPAKQATDLVFPEIFTCLHLTSCGSPYKSCMKQPTL